MSAKEIIGTAVAVFIGTLLALAIAGVYLKSQLSAATGSGSTIGSLLSIFSKPSTGT